VLNASTAILLSESALKERFSAITMSLSFVPIEFTPLTDSQGVNTGIYPSVETPLRQIYNNSSARP
jgi:hypothetical protein